jgi:hypothetical protein
MTDKSIEGMAEHVADFFDNQHTANIVRTAILSYAAGFVLLPVKAQPGMSDGVGHLCSWPGSPEAVYERMVANYTKSPQGKLF